MPRDMYCDTRGDDARDDTRGDDMPPLLDDESTGSYDPDRRDGSPEDAAVVEGGSTTAGSETSPPPAESWWTSSADLPRLWAVLTDMFTNARVMITYILTHVQHVLSDASRKVSRAFSGGDAESAPPPRPEVFRVHAFMGDPYNGEHRDLTHRLDPRFLEDWEARVGALTGWDTASSKFRVEMRYTYGASRKVYRMVLRHGDAFDLPDAQKRCRIPRNILSAQLLGAPGVTCDVLHRVSKYAGPFGDFHAFMGLHVRVQELFPFDDQEQNCARFTTLRTIDTTARIRDYPYADNPHLVPVMALSAAAAECPSCPTAAAE